MKMLLQGVVLHFNLGTGEREEKRDTKDKYFFYLKKPHT